MKRQPTIEKMISQKTMLLKDHMEVKKRLPKFGIRRKLIEKRMLAITAEIMSLRWVLSSKGTTLLSDDMVKDDKFNEDADDW